MVRGKKHPEWSHHDVAIWRAIAVHRALDEDDLSTIQQVATPFPLTPGERCVSWSQFQLCDWRAPGNGTYTVDRGYFFATGGVGLAATALVAMGRSARNSQARAAALGATVPRWLTIDAGTLYVTTDALIMHSTNGGLHRWHWSSIAAAGLAHPGAVVFSGNTTDHRSITWLLNTVDAELVLTLWARTIHPNHPAFAHHAWIPAGWYDRLQAVGGHLPGPITTKQALE